MYAKEGEKNLLLFLKNPNNYFSSKVGAVLCYTAKVCKEGPL